MNLIQNWGEQDQYRHPCLYWYCACFWKHINFKKITEENTDYWIMTTARLVSAWVDRGCHFLPFKGGSKGAHPRMDHFPQHAARAGWSIVVRASVHTQWAGAGQCAHTITFPMAKRGFEACGWALPAKIWGCTMNECLNWNSEVVMRSPPQEGGGTSQPPRTEGEVGQGLRGPKNIFRHFAQGIWKILVHVLTNLS